MKILSTIAFYPTSTEEVNKLVADITPHLHATRDDWLEVKEVYRPTSDSEEDTLYVILHTGNLRGLMADLEDALII